jgi:hypothetical protein
VLLDGNRWEQHLHRLRYSAWAQTIGPHAPARAVARSLKHRWVPRARKRAGGAYATWASRRTAVS